MNSVINCNLNIRIWGREWSCSHFITEHQLQGCCYKQPRRTGAKRLQWVYGWYLLMILPMVSISWSLQNVSQIVIIFRTRCLHYIHDYWNTVLRERCLNNQHWSLHTAVLAQESCPFLPMVRRGKAPNSFTKSTQYYRSVLFIHNFVLLLCFVSELWMFLF